MRDFDQSKSRIHQFPVNGEPPSEVVISAIAEVKDRPATDCPPLYDAIDTDAIDEIFDGRDDGQVTFEYAGCTVSIESNEHVLVEEHE